MSEKIDLIYDLVSKIDDRQRTKSEKDIARHAREEIRMTVIESTVSEVKKSLTKGEGRISTL